MLPVLIYLIMSFTVPAYQAQGEAYVELAQRSFSLNTRYDNSFVNGVFKDNILLTMAYMDGRVSAKEDISWEEVGKPFKYEFSLDPGEGFAFHDQVFPEYKDNIVKTTNAHFNFSDGFKSDGYLMGDGVCHLASLIYWVAKDAGLTAVSPVNHDFAKIPEVPKEYGVSIYALPGALDSSARQNLYIVNDTDKKVIFAFNYDGDRLSVSLLQEKNRQG